MRTGAKAAAALGVAVLVVGAPVAFVVHGAGAHGREDSAEQWWERLRRLPEPVLASPERATAVQAGGKPVKQVKPKVTVLETRKLPVQSPVVAIAQYGEELQAVATFDDGIFVIDQGGATHWVQGVQAVNALAFGGERELVIASDDGIFVAWPGEPARKVVSGAFSAVTWSTNGTFAVGRSGLVRLGFAERSITRWGVDQGVRLSQPTSVSMCWENEICVGAADGLRRFRVVPEAREECFEEVCGRDIGSERPGHLAEVPELPAIPEPFVTAVASSFFIPGYMTTWAGTFSGGLVRLGSAPLTPADGLPEGRINPRALAVGDDDHAFAGTPSGLLVAHGRAAALVPVGGEVTAVTASGRGGVWVGLPGKVVHVTVEFPSELSSLAQSRNP